MKRFLLLTVGILGCCALGRAQSKKPLDHSVYDGWQDLASQAVTNDGKWVLYTVVPQEGDANLYIRDLKTSKVSTYPRASAPAFTEDSKYAAFMIKPFFKDTREAKIKKKTPDQMPKDTLGIVTLGGELKKIPAVKSFKLPEEGFGVIAYLVEKAPAPGDSTRRNAGGAPGGARGGRPAGGAPAGRGGAAGGRGASAEGDDLWLVYLGANKSVTFKYVTDYLFNKDGKTLMYVCAGSKGDTVNTPGVFLYNTVSGVKKKISSGKGSYKNLAFDETGTLVIFTAEKDPEKTPVKIAKLYSYSPKQDSAIVFIDQNTPGMPAKWAVNSDARIQFSDNGKKVFFGTAPIPAPVDTTIVDFEVAKVDIWNYKDDYIQPMQLKTVDRDLKRSFMAVADLASPGKMIQLADEKLTDLSLGQKGNGELALGSTDFGNRIEMQWTGSTARDLYLVSTKDGSRKKIASGFRGNASISPGGRYVVWYNRKDKNWYSYAIASGKEIALNKDLAEKFYDEDNDVPDDPSPYGIAGYIEGDKSVLINDRYDIWQFDLATGAGKNITNGFGRKNLLTLRYSSFKKRTGGFGGRGGGAGGDDPLKEKQLVYLQAFNTVTKENGFYKKVLGTAGDPTLLTMGQVTYGSPIAAKSVPSVIIFEKSSYVQSPDLYVTSDFKKETKLSATNPQQSGYNWGTAELVKWTTPKGYKSEGILYKPEDFDPAKKYPMIVYFYEKLSDGLYSYIPPSPTPSRINISYFVSNGYLVFAPDISYETGHPGPSAIEFINSGVESLKKNAWVDGSKIGIQGQSWGGYQVAYLITKTDMYAAAWAGAPVANMTSAYGGIRWETGMNRQFQYEKTQSRIGATLWEKPELYIENSPLFSLPNVKTPVAIMSNDADGAVPWYQGIEMFTALRRLNKPVWLLNYNGEAHNLVLRQNRKDIQRREQQFFDHFLKGKPAPAWMEKGVPATEKGRNWGFEEIQPTVTAETGK
ncbi:S9 family peptidase [Hufsiella ginkgonis]|uniref:Prolyl oligopeptidase family serine peptidase n=1 Tax=Hufsiella ginkgonis TaxID=2695274 RepID=A0A7K1Y3Y1_9SPHI|nr:prolyl oligopeptidase family serine peptidase [Hufsiella ginkgonis]MXV17961.1 prolyl oligopeptidase family serine peptidase [Hufsiella ginkgonis]